MEKWIIIAVVLVVIAVIIAVVIKKKKSKPVQVAKITPEPVATQDVEKATPKTVVPREESADKDLNCVSEGIRNSAKLFDGLYEGIYSLAKNSDDGSALNEWKIRIENMNENDEFKKAFLNSFDFTSDDLASEAQKLLGCIDLAGVKRAEEAEHTFSLNSSKKYICLSNGVFEEGTLCTVIKPYWFMNNIIIEQGCLMKKEG